MTVHINADLNGGAAIQKFLETLSQLVLDPENKIQFSKGVVSGDIDGPVITIAVDDPKMLIFDLLKKAKV